MFHSSAFYVSSLLKRVPVASLFFKCLNPTFNSSSAWWYSAGCCKKGISRWRCEGSGILGRKPTCCKSENTNRLRQFSFLLQCVVCLFLPWLMSRFRWKETSCRLILKQLLCCNSWNDLQSTSRPCACLSKLDMQLCAIVVLNSQLLFHTCLIMLVLNSLPCSSWL